MSYIVIIRGSLGVGKTTIAKELVKKFNGFHVPIDDVLADNGLDRIDSGDEGIPLENFLKADKIIFPKVREQLKKHKMIVFDGCFYHKEHIQHIIDNFKCPYFVFTLKAPLEVCIERDSLRKKVRGAEAATAIYNLVSKFDYGTVFDVSKMKTHKTLKEIYSELPGNKTLED